MSSARRTRRDALRKLFAVGYDVRGGVLFGTDGLAGAYNSARARQWIQRDRRIYRALRLPASAQEQVFARNLDRFIGAP